MNIDDDLNTKSEWEMNNKENGKKVKKKSFKMLTFKTLHRSWAKFALLCFCLLSPLDIVSSEKFIVKEFSDEFSWLDSEIPQFNNLVVDKNTGRVYIGAVNKLYQLSPGKTLLLSLLLVNEDYSNNTRHSRGVRQSVTWAFIV